MAYAIVTHLQRAAAVMEHNPVLRYGAVLVALLATFYLAAVAGLNLHAQSATVQTESISDTSTQAPNQALVQTEPADVHASGTTSESSSEGSATVSNTGNGKTNASVRVNGKEVHVNGDGEVHKVIRSGGNNTSVDITMNSKSSNSNDSNLDISVESSSETISGN